MAEANPKVMEMVEAELKADPGISNKDLLKKARSIDKGVDELTARQFNATYPLQVKRALNPPRKRARRKKTKVGKSTRGRRGSVGSGSDASRDQIRKVLIELARDVAEGDRGALVEVGAGIDRYVDRVIKAAG